MGKNDRKDDEAQLYRWSDDDVYSHFSWQDEEEYDLTQGYNMSQNNESLTDEQVEIIESAGFKVSPGLKIFPFKAKLRYANNVDGEPETLNNWEEVLEWMTRMKMTYPPK